MRALLLLTLLLTFVSPILGQTSASSDEGSLVVVLGFKWSKSRQMIEKQETGSTAPAVVLTPDSKNFQRSRRINAPTGERDPVSDSEDARRAALEKIVQESRTSQQDSIEGFAYRAKVRNESTKLIEIVFWEYRFSDPSNAEAVTRRQFLCGVHIKPGKGKELQAFSAMGPNDVISVTTLANKSENLFGENVVINRVEYADGSIWQRKGWNFSEIKLTYARAVATPWGSEMCRSL